MHQDIALCYVNCTCGKRLQCILSGWKSFPVTCSHGLILIVFSSALLVENDLGVLSLQTKSITVLLSVGKKWNEGELGETV
jgi:hypothetical protein